MRRVICMKCLPAHFQMSSHRGQWRRTFIWVMAVHAVITADGVMVVCNDCVIIMFVCACGKAQITFSCCSKAFWLNFSKLMMLPAERKNNPVAQRLAAPPPRPGKPPVTCLCQDVLNSPKGVCINLAICHPETSTTCWGFAVWIQHQEAWVIHLHPHKHLLCFIHLSLF